MSSSGLIYAVIVGAWAAYLVPMWLRRQDELNEARPTERFSTAIRLLSGRAAMERRVAKARGESVDPAADTQEQEEDGADPVGPVDVRSLAVPATEVRRPAARPGPASPSASGASATAAAGSQRAKVLVRRRRTTTTLFFVFTVGAVVAAVGGVGLLWVPAVPAVLLTVYIGQMRRQERRRYEVRLDQRHAIEAARRLRARSEAPPAPAAREERPAAPAVPAVPHVRTPSPRTADRRALVEQTDHAEWIDQQRAQQGADDGWDPVPVPLPTYVTAPVAPRTPGGVDLGAADTWSPARSGTTPADPAVSREPREPGPARERDQRPPARRPRGGRTPLFDQYAEGDRPRAANE
ncbi:divisome protein SepX/GlpR [Actinacidiphila sp. ITFR-21]|uniref:divisome protein SepX/GlpR n=1 Tax=Actinacidiphila sp. ITFR-21 TaxID=3075199 RepID=UPI002889C1FB|nr:hypothetical protein [Streptomyces sp. ITFR-21]WNI15887.1 hypothetical protein RLT57_10375 [Streptomyces sp. ITFR-21]